MTHPSECDLSKANGGCTVDIRSSRIYSTHHYYINHPFIDSIALFLITTTTTINYNVYLQYHVNLNVDLTRE